MKQFNQTILFYGFDVEKHRICKQQHYLKI